LIGDGLFKLHSSQGDNSSTHPNAEPCHCAEEGAREKEGSTGDPAFLGAAVIVPEPEAGDSPFWPVGIDSAIKTGLLVGFHEVHVIEPLADGNLAIPDDQFTKWIDQREGALLAYYRRSPKKNAGCGGARAGNR
jgi:hypothetical protein